MQSPSSEYVKKIVKAGAGAGKTHDLIEKIIRMVSPNQIPNILVCTFTKKATQELKERLINKTISYQTSEPEKFKALLTFIKSSTHLHISTIHGVLTLLLQNFGNQIGLDSQFAIVEDTDCLKMRKKLFFDYIEAQNETAIEFYAKWGWEQLSIVLEKHRESVAFNQDLLPLSSELIIFDIQERKSQLSKQLTDLLSQLEFYALKNSKSALFDFFSQLKLFLAHFNSIELPCHHVDQIEILLDLYQKIPQRLGSLKGIPEEIKDLKKQVHEEIQTFLSDAFLCYEFITKFQKQILQFHHWAIDFNRTLEEKKIERAELAIKDLEIFSLHLIERMPQTATLFSKKWDYWFIDEFQDTSPIQLKLLKSLIGEKNYYLVGDPQQSIYFFRGARSQIFSTEWNQLLNSGEITEEKVINRRSQAGLLYFINDFMTTLNSKQFSKMEPFDTISVLEEPIVEFHITESIEHMEITLLIEQINNLLIQNVEPSQIAILCRENKDLLEILKYATKVSAPMQIKGKGDFYERLEVKDALAFHKFLNNPHDDQNLLCLLRGPFFQLSDNDLLKFAKRSSSLWADLIQSDIKNLCFQLIETLELAKKIGIFQAWLELLNRIQFINYYQITDTSGISEANIWKLIYIIKESKLPQVLLNEANALPAKSSNSIQLMTVHASKGLEFDYVLLPFIDGLVRKNYPENLVLDLNSSTFSLPYEGKHPFWSYKISDHTNYLLHEENERLLYVAVTRAKKKLYFFIDAKNKNHQAPWLMHINRFLKPESGIYQIEDKYSYLIKYIKSLG